MVALPLLGGGYREESCIANAQRCVNLYPQTNPEASSPPVAVTHYLAPGLTTQLVLPEKQQVRCLYTATNGNLYAVCGANVYFINSSYTPLFLGTMAPTVNQVKMSDNGDELLIVDGSAFGYQINIITNIMTAVNAATNSGTNGFAFYGGNWVDGLDGFTMLNKPGTAAFASSDNLALNFDPLAFGTKSGRQDFIQSLAVVQRNIWLIGAQETELWSDVGGTNFPFALQQGPYIEHGSAAIYGMAVSGQAVCWITQDKDGNGFAIKGQGYQATRLSNYAVEKEWNSYSTLADAVAFSYTLKGHAFVHWRFPSANKTWVVDLATDQWHERVTTDAQGNESCWRVNCTAFAYGKLWAGDYANGKVYLIDPTSSLDDTVPIIRRRGFPHLLNELKRVRHNMFRLNMEWGNPDPFAAPAGVAQHLETDPLFVDLMTEDGTSLFLDPYPPLGPTSQTAMPRTVWLRWSNDRGRTWGSAVPRSTGATGRFNTIVQWRNLGIAQDRVYEVFWNTEQATAIQGAWIDVEPGT